MKLKPLRIGKNIKLKGLQVVCYECDAQIGGKSLKTNEDIKNCPHPEKHRFKMIVHLPGTKNTRKTKVFDTRDYEQAVKQAMAFKEEIKYGSLESRAISQNQNTKSIEHQPMLLSQALTKHIAFLGDDNIRNNKRKNRSKAYVDEISRAYKKLLEAISATGRKVSTLTIEDLTDDATGEAYEELEKLGLAGKTFNKMLVYYSAWVKWYNKTYKQNIEDHFKDSNRKAVSTSIDAISIEEYQKLIVSITKENGLKGTSDGYKPQRDRYRPWLKDAIRLGLHTGLRREELISVKYQDIKFEHQEPVYIQCEDLKVNRIKRNLEHEKKYKTVPVTEGVKEILEEMGLRDKLDSQEFVLAPEISDQKRMTTMGNAISKGFSHFYKISGGTKNLGFKSLRKYYISAMSLYMGGHTRVVTGHASNQVIQDHYIDKKMIAREANKINILETPNQRAEQLKSIREKTKTTPDLALEK